jgi:hypothetical protein
MRCVGGIGRKSTLNRPTLLSLWHVQQGIDLVQIEVVALEEVGFLLSEKPRCPLINPIKDDIYAPMKPPKHAPWNFFGNGTSTFDYKPLDLNVWPKLRNGKKICHPGIFKQSLL